jgi:hypothetical protein
MNSQSEPGRQRSLPAAPKLRKRSVKKAAESTPEKKKGRTWRDYVLWTVMAGLAVAAGAEFRAQLAYNKALATCTTARDGSEGPGKDKRVKFDDLKGSLPSNPVHTQGNHSAVKTDIYTWTWQGVRRYSVHVYVDPKTQEVWDVDSEPSSGRD